MVGQRGATPTPSAHLTVGATFQSPMFHQPIVCIKRLEAFAFSARTDHRMPFCPATYALSMSRRVTPEKQTSKELSSCFLFLAAPPFLFPVRPSSLVPISPSPHRPRSYSEAYIEGLVAAVQRREHSYYGVTDAHLYTSVPQFACAMRGLNPKPQTLNNHPQNSQPNLNPQTLIPKPQTLTEQSSPKLTTQPQSPNPNPQTSNVTLCSIDLGPRAIEMVMGFEDLDVLVVGSVEPWYASDVLRPQSKRHKE
eukprot:1366005-Rhodomonas_salina.7